MQVHIYFDLLCTVNGNTAATKETYINDIYTHDQLITLKTA